MKTKGFKTIARVSVAMLLLLAMCVSAVSCAGTSSTDVTIHELKDAINGLSEENNALKDKIDALTEKLDKMSETVDKLEATSDIHDYDFYVTVGTLPTLYATLNAYTVQNPNTYMWFERGNTISYEYSASADFINYFPTQSQTNANSTYDHSVIRAKVEEIMANDPEAKFHLYCDDLRVALILNIFVRAGVDFQSMNVTLLSDGTGTYDDFANQTDESYAVTWAAKLSEAEKGRNDPNFVWPYKDNESGVELRGLGYYLTTLPNVDLWVQHPQYLKSTSEKVMNAKATMDIIEKSPKEMYNNLGEMTYDYQKAVLANALVNSDTLTTLEEAAAYFDSQLGNRDKEVVLILGTSKKTMEENKPFIDQTLAFYTPTVKNDDNTKVIYKNKEYDITAGATTVTIDGRTLKIGEVGVYLFFKGHPAHIVDEDVQQYFKDNGVVILPHRTPVEVLFWMYDVKAGGFESTSFLSCYQGQTEFFYGEPVNSALQQMIAANFFEGVAIFTAA